MIPEVIIFSVKKLLEFGRLSCQWKLKGEVKYLKGSNMANFLVWLVRIRLLISIAKKNNANEEASVFSCYSKSWIILGVICWKANFGFSSCLNFFLKGRKICCGDDLTSSFSFTFCNLAYIDLNKALKLAVYYKTPLYNNTRIVLLLIPHRLKYCYSTLHFALQPSTKGLRNAM